MERDRSCLLYSARAEDTQGSVIATFKILTDNGDALYELITQDIKLKKCKFLDIFWQICWK